jgi:hypothetical protein
MAALLLPALLPGVALAALELALAPCDASMLTYGNIELAYDLMEFPYLWLTQNLGQL